MGIERYGEPGEKFDPNLHNAVMHEEQKLTVKVRLRSVSARLKKLGPRAQIRHGKSGKLNRNIISVLRISGADGVHLMLKITL